MYTYTCEELILQLHVREVGSSCTHLYMIHQLLIGLRLLTWPSLLTETQDTIHASQTPNRVNILNQILYILNHLVGFIPTGVFSWPGFPQLTKYGVMILLCVWLYTFLSIIGLFSYAHDKVINNIQLCKNIENIDSPPLSVLSISNNWYQSLVIQKRLNNLNKIPMNMEQLKVTMFNHQT